MWKDKKLLITGGTGSFGSAVLRRFLDSELAEIKIFSRDEKKQDDMRKKYPSSKLKFYIGDVRDRLALDDVMKGIDYVFHAAALKQVPSCEFHPLEAIKTNILGTENVLDSAIYNKVKNVICLSTDKAVYPVNAMGMSKALMEKVAVSKSRFSDSTKICITRYGNVMGSRGSVIPLFVDQIRQNREITITNPEMTRFMMTLDDAVELVVFAFKNGNSGDTFVQKAPAATVEVLAKAITDLLGKPGYPIGIIGTRHGEKLFEALLSSEEMVRADDIGNYYRIPPDLRDLNYSKYIDAGDIKISKGHEYNSHNTDRLSIERMKSMLTKLPIIAGAIDGNYIDPEH